METMPLVATLLSGVNLLLLGALGYVWARNYRTFKTPLVLGLVAFTGVMAVENAVAVYFFFSMGMLYSGSPTAQVTALSMRVLQTIALCFLTWVTMK